MFSDSFINDFIRGVLCEILLWKIESDAIWPRILGAHVLNMNSPNNMVIIPIMRSRVDTNSQRNSLVKNLPII